MSLFGKLFEKKMNCLSCQFENPHDAEFCMECGNRLGLGCPRCGRATPQSGKFCIKCGYNLMEADRFRALDCSESEPFASRSLPDKILTTRTSIEGQRKIAAVLFADLAEYPPFPEQMNPEEVNQIMDGCFKILAEEIYKNHGTINPFHENGVVAIFGFPLPHGERARRACRAAVSIQNAISEYLKSRKKESGVDFKVRIGLSCTSEVDGRVEDVLKGDSAIIKNAIDLARGLSHAAKPGEVLATRGVSILAGTTIDFEYVGRVRVPREEEPREALRLLKIREEIKGVETVAFPGHARFVGRAREKEALLDIYEKVKGGSGQIVDLVGGPGIGK
jgi:class 3 adenylate cyclase/ribosomal protein L40E